MSNPVTGNALLTDLLVVVFAWSDAILRRQSVDDTREASVANGRAKRGLRTTSLAVTRLRADDTIGGPEYGGVRVSTQ
ncbi:hypothetical protein [Halobacterium bonnevillei]|uniref:Uncharacterized protein n=1 Tax=Halobacterium bonnevillei TaxID=2692200 RepID=A0A6B0SXL6_9EURY|nr:hypothetical protein [Halobacterium bonnevillei]MXR22129.1 hypothetical protein [Halobacterium bonnevillei]